MAALTSLQPCFWNRQIYIGSVNSHLGACNAIASVCFGPRRSQQQGDQSGRPPRAHFIVELEVHAKVSNLPAM